CEISIYIDTVMIAERATQFNPSIELLEIAQYFHTCGEIQFQQAVDKQIIAPKKNRLVQEALIAMKRYDQDLALEKNGNKVPKKELEDLASTFQFHHDAKQYLQVRRLQLKLLDPQDSSSDETR